MTPEDFATLPRLLTFTVDVEEHGDPGSLRFAAVTSRLLDLLEGWGGKGTFFVVGEAAVRTPGLVREIARRGHEVASHGRHHRPLTSESPRRFRRDARDARVSLEDLTGAPVLGFRAAVFSLTSRTLWAVDALAEAGFAYSSSVLPARSPAYGMPGAPRRPFLWPNRLLEIPCPVGRVGPLVLPCLGGMYLRSIPSWRLRQLARSLPAEGLWTYCHPYDVDAAEPSRDPLTARFLRWNRGLAAHRLGVIMAGRTSVPFRDRLADLATGAEVFTPARPCRSA